MSLVVDGAEWQFGGWRSEAVEETLDRFLDLLSDARERGEKIWIGDDFQTKAVCDDLDIWSIWGPESPLRLNPELLHELVGWLNSAQCYVDERAWPDGMDVLTIAIDDAPASVNADVAWAHHNVRSGRAVACIGLVRRGSHMTTSSLGQAALYWIIAERDAVAFWRSAFDVEGDTDVNLERFAPHAYPRLYFYEGVWRGLSRMVGGYAAISHQLKRTLAALNDYGAWAFTFPPPALAPNEPAGPDPTARPSNQIVERRFVGLNVTLAPENPDVWRNRGSREAREIVVRGRVLYCEWHAKLQPHQNRIYLHPPVIESGEKVVIGILHEHLPLP
jgi:hypothetical protein